MAGWREGWGKGVCGMKAWAMASLSEDRLMWVSERTQRRNSRLFDSQLSDRPRGLAVQQQSLSHMLVPTSGCVEPDKNYGFSSGLCFYHLCHTVANVFLGPFCLKIDRLIIVIKLKLLH